MGMRQSDIAKKLGVARQTIIAIENNKYNPTLELAIKLSRFFKRPNEPRRRCISERCNCRRQ